MRMAAVLTATILAAGCMTANEPGAGDGASAELRNAAGATLARAEAVAAGDGTRVTVNAVGLRPGTYAVHVHTTGRCDAPAFESAGAHWNPTTRQHGAQNPRGPHQGDLPNLTVGANGSGAIAFTIPGAQLRGGNGAMLDADGAAVVVHANADDYRTDPSGNSGGRIGCGILF